MSKIFDLINKSCSEGVKFDELGVICKSLTKGTLKQEDLIDKGAYPVVNSSRDYYGFYNKYNNEANAFTIASRGEYAGFVKFIDCKFWAGGLCYPYTSKDEDYILTKFIFYFLKSIEKKNMDILVARGSIPALNKSDFDKVKVPVPSIEVQREIVRILDSFTLLTAELTAELTARKKQYEFYRDFLLNFNEDQNEIKWDIIDNIFIMKNGYTPSKANKDFWENGTICWYRMEDIRENGRILSESIQKITPQAVKGGKLIPKNSIIVATTATIGEHALAIADSFLMNQRFTSFTIRELLKDKLDIKFVFYYFFKICEWCKQNTNSSSFPSVDMAKLKKVKFPIPSPQTQQKVVEILDKFDTLVNSITEGLPREIELRRKQYEYYREKLLNFTELKKEI
ncbi:restriction endonuclease subunit S [Campylobacter concisus]|uniref:restriction endonuclease subunit S n=1 Tax=Campylobacter concisus TaxID=199 RepID=UPI00195708DF|nr:restriction endonuclease subunit S [Campylobacter concisus]VTX98209.1 Type I restriction modification DNA specificity domain protein [Campylobacter concisus]